MGILGWSMFAGETRLVGMMLTNRRRCQLLQLHDAPLTRHPSANDRTEWVWSPESNCLLLKRVNKHSNLLAIHAWMLTPTSMEWNDSKNVKVINISHQIGHTPAHFHPFPNSQLLEEFQASSSVSTRELSRRPKKKRSSNLYINSQVWWIVCPKNVNKKHLFQVQSVIWSHSGLRQTTIGIGKPQRVHGRWGESTQINEESSNWCGRKFPIRREISGATDPLDVWWKHRWPRDLCWTNSSNHSKLSLRE